MYKSSVCPAAIAGKLTHHDPESAYTKSAVLTGVAFAGVAFSTNNFAEITSLVSYTPYGVKQSSSSAMDWLSVSG